tara:strand:- start:215 stop:550 length:336 start_codon:yes stop_codon:yes gene_type:complete
MREIVKDALKCEELVHQFFYIDREDVESDINDEIINKFYPDKYLIKEAKHRLDIANENLDFFAPEDEDFKSYAKGHKQLTKFIGKWENKCEPHENDGLSWEKLKEKIEGVS